MTLAAKPKEPVPAQRKRPSVIREIFNPHLGESIRPLGESYNMFVQLLAFVFVAQGLFPREHPGFDNKSGVKLGLQEVIVTAYNKLSFTKEGLPKVLIFAGVVGSMIISVLGLVVAFMGLFLGHAHAQTTFFTPPDANNDIAYNLIQYLFDPVNTAQGGTNLGNVYQTDTGLNQSTMPTITIQQTLWAVLGYYSDAMLIFAAILLFYHLAAMVVDTAHSGVTMGKSANQVWAPVRLVLAVALLVPVSSGLNSGQYVVVKMAEIGSALASNVWAQFVNGPQGLLTQAGKFAIPNTPELSDLVTGVAQMAGCEYAYNWEEYTAGYNTTNWNFQPQYINKWYNGYGGGGGGPWNMSGVPQTPQQSAGAPAPSWPPGGSVLPFYEVLNDGISDTGTPNSPGTQIYHFVPSFTQPSDMDVCGAYSFPPKPHLAAISGHGAANPVQNIIDQIYTAQLNEFTTMVNQVMPWGAGMANCCIGALQDANPDNTYITGPANGANGPFGGNIPLTPTTAGATPLATIMDNYQTNLTNDIVGIISGNINMADSFANQGWLGAGAFFNELSQLQAEISSGARDTLPHVTLPQIGQVSEKHPLAPGDLYNNVINDLAPYGAYIESNLYNVPTDNTTIPSSESASAAVSSTTSLSALIKNMHWNLVDSLFAITDYLAAKAGVWSQTTNDTFSTGIRFSGAYPLAQISDYGHRNVDLAFSLTNWGAAIVAVGSIIQGSGGFVKSVTMAAMSLPFVGPLAILPAGIATVVQGLGGLVYMLGAALVSIALVFFTIGFLLGFILPLLPFMHFFLGSLTWLACLFEAVIAVPLVAIAHITPNGEGLPGPMARSAYFMLFSLLLRPVLMVFGLIFGYMLLIFGITLLNILFTSAVQATGGVGTSHLVFVRIAYTVIYCGIIITMANHAFRLIDYIPDRIMSWIGQSGQSGMQMGRPEDLERYGVIGAGFAFQKVSGAAGAIASAPGNAIGKAGETAGQAVSGMGQYLQQGKATQDATAAAALATERHEEMASIQSLSGQRLGNMASTLDRMESAGGAGGTGGGSGGGSGGGGGATRGASGEPNNPSMGPRPSPSGSDSVAWTGGNLSSTEARESEAGREMTASEVEQETEIQRGQAERGREAEDGYEEYAREQSNSNTPPRKS